MSVTVYEPHGHALPDPSYYVRGTVTRCSCGRYFVGGNPGNPAYSSWRYIGWFGVGWRRVIGRIP